MERGNGLTSQIVTKRSGVASSDVARDDEFMVLLRKLDLYKYYPGKMKREDVVGLTDEELIEQKIEKTEDLGRIFLHRLLSCNYGARDLEIITQSTSKPLTVTEGENPGSTTSIFGKRKLLSSSPPESQSKAINPLDVVLAVFLCADPILQQDIATLLWKCKLAIPFITQVRKCDIPIAHVWPLRSICARWTVRKDGKVVVEEDSILTPPFFTIGFMRFESTSVKKSITINTLMSDTEKAHPIFYHRNSRGSTRQRLLADGMIEISWYLPSNSGENLCNEPITVLNLRGNALIYHKQRQMLMEMASVCFFVCHSSDLDNEEVESIVKTILRMNKKVFVITYDDEENKGMPFMQLEEDVFVFNTESLTDAKLKESIKVQFRELEWKNTFQRTSIDNFSWKDVSVDQERQQIKDGLLQAELIMKSLVQEQPECRKDKLLPLHQELWKKWVETDKEIHRLKKLSKSQDITQYRNELAMEKVNTRRKQLELLQSGVSEAVANFLKALNIEDKVTRAICVRWLKIQMEKLSRRELRQLLNKETVIQEKVSAFKDKYRDEQENLQKELENIQELKNKSNIGLEHFFRELGQIYEAIETQAPGERHAMGYDLPLLAARFLLDGNSLEIYDGDVGSVPITWVSAVFESLSKIVTELTGRENPKCTVMTVYGMQSSGKSTLLNTMFGCQFTVSAGKCTTGVQIQMLKVNDSKPDGIKVDYILLVDTEGVRSPEVPEEVRRSRDNEITTFVIGLGQKTLINLMGENTTYLTEVLPIAVRAFLRMGCVGLKPSCSIVYQNVDSQSRDEISSQNRKLQEELDNQTVSACQMEKKEQKRFYDVIEFDIENDIHYIPSLWEGEQPMATVSQGYSKGTLKLKNSFQQFCKQRTGQRLTSYSLHINSLWTAMAKDDFVYFFRNTLETEARERLDKVWCNVVWEFRMEASKCGTKMHTDIKNCPDPDKLDEIGNTSRAKVREYIAVIYEHLKQKLVKFFGETPQKYKLYTMQWEALSIDGLTKMREDLIGDIKIDIGRLQRLKESKFLVERKVQQFKDRIRNEIVEYFKGERKRTDGIEVKLMPREEIRQVFEEKWNGWLNNVENMCDVRERNNNIAREAVDILREKFSSHETLVIQNSDTLLSGTVVEFRLKQSHFTNTKDETANTLILAESIVQETIREVGKYVNELTQDPSPYKKGSIEEIIQMVSVKENELEALGVKTTVEFEIEISIAVVSMAVNAFLMSENNFFDSFDPIPLLEKEKETFFILFEKHYEKTSFTHSFASRVSELLINAIRYRVDTDIVREVADDMRSRVYMEVLNNKKSFIYTILCRMTSDDIFRRFMEYIENPTKTIDDWIERYVDEYSSASRGNPSKLRILLDRLVMGCVKDLIAYAEVTEKQLDKRTDNTKEMDKTNDVLVKLWVKEFTEKASEKFEVNEVRGLSDLFGEDMLDFQFFYVELLKRIETTSPNLDDLTNMGKVSYKNMKRNVVKNLRNIVVGCTEDCPFCGEICISSQPNHGGLHETPVHRPQGCKGYLIVSGRVLVQESCQKLVATTDRRFSNDQTQGEFVHYKDYQTIHTDWKIPGDPNPLTSTFWEWFMFAYIANLETEHYAVRPTLPEVWGTYTKEGEIEKLKREMNK